MTEKIVTVATLISLMLMGCQNNPKTVKAENKNTRIVEHQNETKMKTITFTLAKNYFVQNTVEKVDNPKIETAEKFNEIFGMATTMGKDGKPTEIDFSKQYVIAVILPETDLSTHVSPISLLKTGNEITLHYKSVVGQKQSWTTRPNFAIIIDKKENGNVLLKEIK
jgi:uncharacterized lipoprotein NlpE involved in copper resistance